MRMQTSACVPTYCAAVRGPHHVVVLELEVLVEHGRVQLDLAVQLVADLLPVGGWLRHSYRPVMAFGRRLPGVESTRAEVRSSCPCSSLPIICTWYLHRRHVMTTH